MRAFFMLSKSAEVYAEVRRHRGRRWGWSLALAALSISITGASASVVRGEGPAAPAIDGIRCDRMESGIFHIHQHLAIYDHGEPMRIPDDVGRPIVGECLYWLHTHTSDGLIHIESPVARTFFLGNFFDIWGEPLSATRVGPVHLAKGQLRVFLNGRPFAKNPRKIELNQHSDIVLEAGPPYVKPAPFNDWRGQ